MAKRRLSRGLRIKLIFWKVGGRRFARILLGYFTPRRRWLAFECLGSFNPHKGARSLCFSGYRLAYWLNRGATVTPAVLNLLLPFSYLRKLPEEYLRRYRGKSIFAYMRSRHPGFDRTNDHKHHKAYRRAKAQRLESLALASKAKEAELLKLKREDSLLLRFRLMVLELRRDIIGRSSETF